MAEINVEKKKPVWPWVLMVLVVIALVVVWIAIDNGENTPAVQTQTEQQEQSEGGSEVTQANGAVEEFITFVQENEGNVDLHHEYTATGLTHLANALEAFAKEHDANVAQDGKINDLKQMADRLQKDPMSEQHADIMADAFKTAAGIMQELENNLSADQNKADQVMQAAEDIKPEELATEQKEEIKNFFEEAANTLEDMSNNTNV